MGKNKFGARRVFYKDHWFDSVDEARRYDQLVLLELAGEICGLRLHPTYLLQPGFRDETGRAVRAIKYTPDFEYIEDGATVVEDVKSEITRTKHDYSMSVRLFKAKYPNIKFKEVLMRPPRKKKKPPASWADRSEIDVEEWRKYVEASWT